ncbi:MAG TPA: hypothetical protein VFM11_08145 [Burkholderiales bacterium]|nr:hypothetical protein [Burkholderiales bacterium]
MQVRMRMMLPAAAALLIAGCVTINIYFPAAAAQKAADKIIDDVWQLKQPAPTGGAGEQQPPASAPQPAQQPAPAEQPGGQSKP